MRLHRLELEGFGPFRARQSVDFDAFSDDGIFLIGGRTGAGKSSILDGVCFALYGTVPRYESGEKRLRSDHCAPDDPTSVMVEFTTGTQRWRVTRSPDYERPKKRGEGTTHVGATAQLDELCDGVWIGRASGARGVGEALAEVLQLSVHQFLQVILLAQNRFARFLLADSRERQAVLRTLFGSRRFEEYERALADRRKEAERVLESADDEVGFLLKEAERTASEAESEREIEENAGSEVDEVSGAGRSAAERIDALSEAIVRAEHRVAGSVQERSAAEAAQIEADTAHAARTALRDAQTARAEIRTKLASSDAQREAIDRQGRLLERARRAEPLRSVIDLAERAQSRCIDASTEEDRAREAWRRLVPEWEEIDADEAAALRAAIDTMSAELIAAESARAHETRLAETQQRTAELDERIAELQRAVREVDTALAAYPAEAERLALEAERFQKEAAGGGPAREQLELIIERRAAADQAQSLAVALMAAEAAQLQRSAELDAASGAVTALLQRRMEGIAGELAEALVEGVPCAVCGALEHPRPALPAADPVTREDIAAAERTRGAASRAARAASDRAQDAQRDHAQAHARAGGESLADLDAALERTRALIVLSERAEASAAAAEAERARRADEDARSRVLRQQLDRDLDELRQRRAESAAAAEQARSIVEAARGEFSSVADRVSDLTARRDSAQAYAEAQLARLAADAAHSEAKKERDARIDEAGFLSAEEVGEALWDEKARADAAEALRVYERERERLLDRLDELDRALEGVPEGEIDCDVTAAAAQAARARWTQSVAAADAAARALRTLRDFVERAIAAHAGMAELSAERDAIVGLAHATSGGNEYRMTLETFVLAAELEEIVHAANLRLEDMSAGRYRLRHTDSRAARGAASGLGIDIVDAHTGQPRPTQSLSGGETFLASLALALGLAEVVTARAGGIRLDTLFIDEGFGALDPDTLDLAMRTLDELRQGGRTVGIISHVEAMKEDIPAQLQVVATSQGPSVIMQGG